MTIDMANTTRDTPHARRVHQEREMRPQPRTDYASALEHLSELSVCKYHDPFTDIDWDAPAHQIDASDPRLCIPDEHPLALTPWYRGLDPATRARFGLTWLTQTLKYGIGFEAVLSRGLLEFCQTVPDRSPEYRYAMHEVIEEARHSQMFQQFIDRSGVDTVPLSGLPRVIDDQVAHLGRRQPVLFFFAVLGAEIFIDQQNRDALRRPKHSVHPLVRLIMKIHVMEESRHVCFAQRYLQEHLPQLSLRQRTVMGFLIPGMLGDAARTMLVPDARLAREFAIPRAALDAAFGPGGEHRRNVAQATAPMRRLCAEHGLLQPAHLWLWRAAGLLG